jgi:hypothetical protein
MNCGLPRTGEIVTSSTSNGLQRSAGAPGTRKRPGVAEMA